MGNIEQCRFCKYLDLDRPSFYGESYRCTHIHRFVDPYSRCEDFMTKARGEIIKAICGEEKP